VLAHTFFALWLAAHTRPQNLFTRLSIPLTAPTEYVRSLLLDEAVQNRGGAGGTSDVVMSVPIPPDVEVLLSRLASPESRALYSRFGQRAMQTCSFCQSSTDYSLFTLPGIVLAYLRTAILVACLASAPNYRARFRTYALGLLACAALAEGYAFTVASDVPLPKNGRGVFMWHDTLHLARHLLFTFLPIVIQLLPPIPPPVPPTFILQQAQAHLERGLARTHLLKRTRGAVLRNPSLREKAVSWWTRNAQEGARGRADEGVRRAAERAGLGYDEAPVKSGLGGVAAGTSDVGGEGALRVNARAAVDALSAQFAPYAELEVLT